MRQHPLNTIALATLLAAGGAQAQQAADAQLPPVRVTDSPIIESNTVDGYSGYGTKVTDGQVRDLSALDLAAALRMTPGVQISRYNEVGSYSGDQGGNVYIRGLGASRPGSEIKTYVDGLPVYMGLWNHPLMDLLPLNGVDSIDIQKGPQPMSSGNNFAAVNLTTKKAREDGVHGKVNVSVGSYATSVAQANLLGRTGDVDFMLAAGKVNSNGARNNADSALNNAMGRIGLKLNGQWGVGASFLTVDNRVGDPGDSRYATSSSGVGPYTFSNGVARNETATTMVSAFLTHQHGDWRGEFKVYDNRGKNNLVNDPNWGTFNSGYRMNGLRWKEEFSPWQDGQVIAGVDQDDIRGDITGPHVGAAVGTAFAFNNAGSADIPSFRIISPYAGLSQKINLSRAWVMQPSVGVRHYDSNHYASKTAPNAGLSFISDRLTVYANYAQGILYPGAETYTLTRALPMAFTANNGWDRLSPTENQHKEIGLMWDASASTHVDLSVFQDDISKRYIWSGFSANATGVWSNSYPDYRVNGVELAVKHQLNRLWSLFGGVTTLDSSIANLPYAPRTAVTLATTGAVGVWRVVLDAQYQSNMYSLTQDRGTYTPNQVDAFTVANARVSHPVASLGKKGEVYAALNNLFDTGYQYNAGYPMPGRNFRVGLVASF
jgi:iron complex outermembrane receptor protein